LPIGNDIVDLRDPETRPGALHPRFDQRVFTPAERERIVPGEPGHRTRWLMWAAKESAYKATKKLDPRTVFSPRRFEVELQGERAGVVRFGDSVFSLLAEISDELVHVVATPATELMETVRANAAGRPALETGKRFLLQFETARLSARARDALVAGLEVRQMAARALGSLLEIPRQRIELIRRGQIPRALFEGVRLPIDLSLSHHGRFGAFAFMYGAGASVL
jgi:phosphopantetheinyl transferase (holo-ACP synthase)